MYETILFIFVGVLVIAVLFYLVYLFLKSNTPETSGKPYCNANPVYQDMYKITGSTRRCVYQGDNYDLYIIPVKNQVITVASWLTSNQDVCGKYCYYNTETECYDNTGNISSNQQLFSNCMNNLNSIVNDCIPSVPVAYDSSGTLYYPFAPGSYVCD